MAAELKQDDDVEVKTVKGGLGELSVFIDGQKVIDTNRLWYPRSRKIVNSARTLLAK